MTERVLIVGTGLIGGSVGLALRRRGDVHVVGFDTDAANADRARDVGAVDEIAADPGLGSQHADVVVVATPVGEVLGAVDAIARAAPAGTLVTDVGSTKGTIVAQAETLLGPERPFVGGHPMAGTDGEGVVAARADLFDGALWILTPTESTDSSAFRRVNTLVTGLGARTLALDPDAHDRLVARVSHLPYALATALMSLVADDDDARVFDAAAGSFRDVTRTAGTNPRIWHDILSTNADAVGREIKGMVAKLETMREALERGDLDTVDALIDSARSARRRLPLKGERTPADPITVEIHIPDRTGVLAEVTTALGEGGINIEDVWMDHTAAGGTLRITVDGRPNTEAAIGLLSLLGFRATVLEEA